MPEKQKAAHWVAKKQQKLAEDNADSARKNAESTRQSAEEARRWQEKLPAIMRSLLLNNAIRKPGGKKTLF